MSTYPVIKVKPGSEIHLKNRHHAIFRTAFGAIPEEVKNGMIGEIHSSADEFLCYATINRKAYIAGRAISFEPGDPMESLRRNIKRSIDLRKEFLSGEDTTAFRLINAEGDGIPGLVVDQYGPIVVIQLTTLGMDRLRPWIADTLMDLVKPEGVFEKSTGSSRKKEGLENKEGWVKDGGSTEIEIKERGLKYLISLTGSQKTGLFIDQREMRSLVRQLAAGRTVLDCCSYVGGFSLNALMGGALSADAVDYDENAIAKAKVHMQMNGIAAEQFTGYKEDVFDFLRRTPKPKTYDFIILDPPAFAKRSTDLELAKHAYTDMNRMAMQSLPSGSLLLTCSCSYQMDPQTFQTVVFHAARQARRNVRILQRHRHAFDHPINLYHPEVDYLKSLLLWIE